MLTDALMRSFGIEVGNVGVLGATKMGFILDNNIIQAFATNRASKSLTKGVSRRSGDRGLENVDACSLSNCPDVLAVLAVIVAHKEAQGLSKRRGFSDLLRKPGIRWVAGDTDMYHSP